MVYRYNLVGLIIIILTKNNSYSRCFSIIVIVTSQSLSLKSSTSSFLRQDKNRVPIIRAGANFAAALDSVSISELLASGALSTTSD